MKFFRNFSIQKKMLLMTLLICGAVLLVAIATLFIFQVVTFRSNYERDTATLATIIAKNCTAAITFNDDTAANEILSSLKVKATVLSASLQTPNDSLFAHYGWTERTDILKRFPPAGESHLTAGHLLFTQPVMLKNDRIGTLYLRTDYDSTFWELVNFYARVVLAVFVASFILAWVLSSLLGRAITRPVLQLAKTAKIIGEKKDYSVRATVNSRGDELGQLAESFNEMLGRIESQDAALSLSQQKMETLIHSIDGIVWERKPDTFEFTFISRQSQEILGYTPQAWLAQPNFWEEKLFPQDAAKAVRTGHEMAERGEPYSYEYRMRAADGRTIWIRESGMVLVEKGQSIAMRGIFQDITRQKLDAEQLDKLNRQLIDTSRSAGMADVATGVLHNVGNVLNSVSVSATVVADRLRRFKISKLCRAAAMMQEQNGHLGEYLTNDPKGKLLPEFFSSVSSEMAGEQTELIAKMETVGEHIEHIKEIVAMQQNYAKVSGVYEYLTATTLVEDALRINATAFDRHRIELVKEFEENTPTVCVDRHKVLQILINLLRNAKHAMEEQNGRLRRMTVRISGAGADSVKISIADTGVGIPAEHMGKIFNQGFTTKKDGHGFGLHSGANAAREMGGSLTAHSDGPGQGAEFTLVLTTSPRHRKTETVTQG